MREALILVPTHDNDGKTLGALRDRVAKFLCQTFGGATATPAMGFWVNDHGRLFEDTVTQFAVAMEPTATNRGLLRDIATIVGRDGRQEAVYIRHADGEVEIRDTAHLWQQPEQVAA